MEEQEYKATYQEVNPFPCPFGKAILSSRCGCQHFQRVNIAEREAAACRVPEAHTTCTFLLDKLYQNAQFALKLPKLDAPLPHAKAMKVQCGGLLGLKKVLHFSTPEDETKQVTNIYAIVTQALKEFESIEQLPYQEIIRDVVHYVAREKRR